MNEVATNTREYRKHQNALMVAGQGIIMMCAWSVLKYLMYLTVDREYLVELIIEAGGQDVINMVIVITIIIAFIDVCIRLKIGRAAIAVAKGEERKSSYLVLTAIYLIVSVGAMFLNVGSGAKSLDRTISMVSSYVLELLSWLQFIAILVASAKVRVYRRKQRGGE